VSREELGELSLHFFASLGRGLLEQPPERHRIEHKVGGLLRTDLPRDVDAGTTGDVDDALSGAKVGTLRAAALVAILTRRVPWVENTLNSTSF
jgi:hypothetical protein